MKSAGLHYLAAALLLAGAAGLAFYGQPDVRQKWEFLASEYEPRLINRDVQVDPGELLDLMQNDYIELLIVDLRSESDWNLFHLRDAERIPLAQLAQHKKRFASLPGNAVLVLVSNDETLATRAWQDLMVLAQPNAYILQGGLNYWLDIYGYPNGRPLLPPKAEHSNQDETLRHSFQLALGARHPAASPDPHHVQKREFQSKVKLITKIQKKGGCG
jgi:rhodanese-related sulfurtransferase